MKKRVFAGLMLLAMIFSLLPTSVIAAGADDMPRVGFMVRLLPHQETTTEEAYLESGSTVEAYTDLYPYVYLRPYIEGQPFPPQKNIDGWTQNEIYYTWEFQDVIDGVVREDRGAPFNQETVYQYSNAGSGKKFWQITAMDNTETDERLGDDCYRVIIKKRQTQGYQKPNLTTDPVLGEASMDLHVRMTRVTLTSLEVTTAPTKTAYTEQETLDLTGLAVTLTYSDGSSEEVGFADFQAKGISTSPAHDAPLQADDTTVTISKDGHSDTVEITVHPMPQVAAPSFSPPGGTYAQPQTVELSTATADATIYYTTDGTTPTTASTVYNGPIQVNGSMTLKAIAVKSGMKDSEIASAAYTIPEAPSGTITITPQNITAYTGGDSMGDTSFPVPRYQVTACEGVNLADVKFTVGGKEVTLPDGTANGERLPIDWLEVSYTLEDDNQVSDNDGVAGKYTIKVTTGVTAATTAGHELEVVFEDATYIIRYVSNPEDVLDNVDAVATEIVTTEGAVDTSKGMAVAVIPEGAAFYTNGKEELGLLGNGDEEAQISLMFDDLIPREDIISGEGADTTKLLADYAKEKGHTLTDGQYQFKYLDLVNEHDGNAWVSTDKPITIFWPYPDTVKSDHSDYTFSLLHFKGLHREYDAATETELKDLIATSTLETITVEQTEKGIKFTLPGNSNEGSFSPFALTWEKKATPPQDFTVTFLPGDHGTLIGETIFTVMDNSTMQASGYTVPTINEDSNYDFIGWKDQNGSTYTSSQVLALCITGSMTFTAQYHRQSPGGGGTTHYTLHYASNGGTEYKDEWYARNTVVELDKVPTREGYTFTGWYADRGLTERITEIQMTSNKTVYAGWETTGVPPWLNGRDHFAYVIGYADGTVRPLDYISRAEVVTILFRLLDPEIRAEYLTTANPFVDVNEDLWCNTAISTLARLGIVNGRTPESFDPYASITRAEFAAICARFDKSGVKADSNFTDISGHWAEDEIERAATLGWIRGYTDGTFRPSSRITRAEVMTMINRMLQRLPEDEDDLLPNMYVWPDNQPGEWYYLAVQEATNSHNFDRKSDGVHEHWTEMTADPNWKEYE